MLIRCGPFAHGAPGKRHFNATLFANDTTMLESLVLPTQALVILSWAKDARTKEAVTFRFERTIVNSFGLFYFAK